MKKQSKTTQLALGILVLLIWGLVAYRFKRLGNGTPGHTESTKFVSPEAIPALAQDTYHLVVNYPDPFLAGTSLAGEIKSIASAGHRTATAQPNPTKLSQGNAPPAIQCKGFSRDSGGRLRARLAVNGKGMTLMGGESFGNLNVLAVFKDSVQIKWDGKKYTLLRQKHR